MATKKNSSVGNGRSVSSEKKHLKLLIEISMQYTKTDSEVTNDFFKMQVRKLAAKLKALG